MASVAMSKVVSVSIGRVQRAVYEFASNPRNLPRWAPGLLISVRRRGKDWIAKTRQGPIRLRFAKKNGFGVLDHFVTPGNGAEVYVPMRVVRNGEGSEVALTIFRRPGMSDAEFAADARAVRRDLVLLKRILEAE